MDKQDQIPKPEASLEVLDAETVASVDDFIRELEAKEKDLHITADMKFEVEDADIDTSVPDFIAAEVSEASPATEPSQPQKRENGTKTQIYEMQLEIDRLNDRLTALRLERNEIQEKSDRRLKDFENYKYRMDRERRGAFIEQISTLASQMLPVLDNLDRALASAEKIDTKKSVEFQQFYDGIVLVNQQVNEVFAGIGVSPITTVGEKFDPNFHEAVSAEERADLPANTILEEMLRGYRIGNRVIRHSMVKVTAAPQPPRKSAEEKPVEAESKPASIPEPESPLPDPLDGSLPEE
ncbi:MAG: nucleotide exchange factor GrpE [Acidobacteria bacterium]|nr:nucleotide exchange factor GrpE [Acidobacteriota bacterium]